MIRSAAFAFALAFTAYVAPSMALAQEAPPTYIADPSVYKLIFEDPIFRVIAATWRPGQTDKPHSHPVPSVVYPLTNCTIKLTPAWGEPRIVKTTAGHPGTVPYEAAHTATNLSRWTCRAVFVEHK